MDAKRVIPMLSPRNGTGWIKTTEVVGSTLVGCKGHGIGMWLQTRQGAKRSTDSSMETVCVFGLVGTKK